MWGNLVGAFVTINCGSARVGSIVAVISGVGVGGGSTTGNVPPKTSTSGEYTQAALPVTPGYST